ncbi:MAG: DUF4268 domain-containing protein, partial [Chloroflexota bacterium]
LKKVNIREIWPHEAQNFTPWLAENIGSLSEAVGMDLELIQQEANVGDFSLDILVKDLGSNHNVIIENQFGNSDHDHLGKLITYASGYAAHKIIWISEFIRDEHKAAMQWLNEHTDRETQFFAIEIEVFRIDESKPVFNFKPAVFPNEWGKSQRSNSSQQPTIRGEAYRQFFQALTDELREKYKFTKSKLGQPQSWYIYSTGYTGAGFSASFATGKRIRIELYLDGETNENKNIYDWLASLSGEIEAKYGESLTWERLDDKFASRIAIYRDGNIEDIASLVEIRSWCIKNLLKFKEVFTPYLQKYKNLNGT